MGSTGDGGKGGGETAAGIMLQGWGGGWGTGFEGTEGEVNIYISLPASLAGVVGAGESKELGEES